MISKYAPLISFFPLTLLAMVAWRTMDPPSPGVTAPAEPAGAGVATAESGSQAPPPPGVDLSFRDGYAPLDMDAVFVTPAGPKGMKFTPATAALNGAKVRVTGQMVKHLHDDPQIFLLTKRPLVLIMKEFGLADDLPASAVHVLLSARPGWAPRWTPRPLEVCGVLELGPRQELDGRISHLRLVAEHVIDTEAGTLPELMKPIGLQPGRLTQAWLAADASPPPPPPAPSLSSSTQPTHQPK